MSLIKKMPALLQKYFYLLVVAFLAYLAAVVVDKVTVSSSSLQRSAGSLQDYVQHNQENFLQKFSGVDYNNIVASGKPSEENLIERQTLSYFTYFYRSGIYSGPQLVSWSNNKILPPEAIINNNDSAGIALLANGYYVWFSSKYPSGKCIALLPVKWNYFIANNYLKNNFVAATGIATDNNLSIAAGKAERGNVNLANGKTIFHLTESTKPVLRSTGLVSTCLRIISILSLLIFLHFVVSFIAMKFGGITGWSALVVSLGIIRFSSYLQPFHSFWRQWELFDPSVYGSNYINSSLGDLLINVLLGLWIILFFRQQVFSKRILITPGGKAVRQWAIIICGSCGLLLCTFMSGGIVRSLVADAQISFDVLNFFSLNVYSVIGFFILTALGIAYYFLCHTILYLLRSAFPGSAIPIYLSTAIAGLFILSFRIGEMQNSFELYLLLWFYDFCVPAFFRKIAIVCFQVYHFPYHILGVLFFHFYQCCNDE